MFECGRDIDSTVRDLATGTTMNLLSVTQTLIH
jgi:hypothetical protein